MTAKPDRKSMLKSSMANEAAAVAARFDLAEEVMQGRNEGLLSSSQTVPTDIDAGLPPVGSTVGQSPKTLPGGTDEVVRINLENLQDNPFNARQIYKHELVKERAASIVKNGQLTAATVATDPDRPGFYFLIDGHYRKRALKFIGRDEMDCVIRTVETKTDLYRLSFVLNEERSGQTALDNALAWKKMLDQGTVRIEEDICELTSMSKANVNKTLALAKLPLRVIDRISEAPEKFGVALGYETVQFFKQSGEEATLDLITRILEEDMSSRDVEKLRKSLEMKPPRKPREISRQYKIQRDGQEVGYIKDWDSGKITIEINALAAEERTELVNQLASRFKIEQKA
ncbi:MAG: ParB/RepB/Spo0J family partition protein [Candidatus Methylumidiphilus sp.]